MLPGDEFEREHPSYGILHIHRVTGGPGAMRLFGSPLAHHYGTIRISVGKAKWIHGHHHDRFYGSLRGEHIEIEMSAAQFADAFTSLNMGDGTPCTLRYLKGERIPDPPDYPTEAEHIRDSFDKSVETYADKARTYADKIMELTARLPAKVRREIEIALDVIQHQLTSNIPFVLQQFQEATTRVTTSAKAEVHAFVTHAMQSAGLEAIAGRLPSLLPRSSEDEPKLALTGDVATPAPRECTCVGECKGADGLAPGWVCALGKRGVSTPGIP